ncbi:MAG: hypothetical protein AABN95_20810 [Acidobacteriota bacterium]
MNRIIILTALATAFIGFGCTKTQQPSPAATAQPTPINDAESINSVEGSFTVTGYWAKDKPPEAVTLTQAYARRVKNKDDQTRPAILILLTEKPVALKVLAEADDDKGFDSSSLQSKLDNRGVRGIQLLFAGEKKAASGGEDQDSESESESESDFDSVVYFNGSIQTNVLEFKPAVFTADEVQGNITARGDWEGQFNINFKVSLRPQGWTGGVFFVQPPTNLSPGTANGQIVVDGKATRFNYVYARQQKYDLFDEKNNVVKLFFTEKPVPEDALGENIEHYLSMKRAGNVYVMLYQLTAKDPSGFPHIWHVGGLADSQTHFTMETRDLDESLMSTDIDLSKFDDSLIDGRLYTPKPYKSFDSTYELDVSFNAQINKPDETDAPVKASQGQPLPSDGGEPGKAYLAFLKGVEAAGNLKELAQVLETSLSAKPSEEAKKSLASVPVDEEDKTFNLFKTVLLINDPRIEGGLVSGDKATLSFTGMDGGQKANGRVNMHLENGQWKVGASSTHMGDMK